ncbi:MAG TPA: NUDIX domain-containing protein [Caulobacteraceae bacterium]|jgi:nudix-type nucleoside diphosphatase (YffH/AdpP family)
MPRIINSRLAYDGYAKVTVLTLADEDGAEHSREVVATGQSACVLPYDAERGVALLVHMPRAPLIAAAITEQLTEAPAGMLADGESAETCIRREAMEEAGVQLGVLEPVAVCWPSPGVLSERIHLFLARYALADRIGEGGGLADEHESISVSEKPLAELWRDFQRGALNDLKTLTLVLALHERSPELF